MSIKDRIKPEELSKAIFIDYEGNIDRSPTLLGWRVDGITYAAILEEAFSTCSDRYRAKNIFYRPHCDVARQLLNLALEENRILVSWSEHDLRVINAALSDEDQTKLLVHFRNAIKTAKSWHASTFNSRAPQRDLPYFSKRLGFPIPPRYGPGKVGQGLRLIRNQLLEGRQYADLTPKARKCWVEVVKHNALDLRAMEYVLKSMLQVPLKRGNPDQMTLSLIHPDD